MIKGGANQRGIMPKSNVNLASARGAKYREYGKYGNSEWQLK